MFQIGEPTDQSGELVLPGDHDLLAQVIVQTVEEDTDQLFFRREIQQDVRRAVVHGFVVLTVNLGVHQFPLRYDSLRRHIISDMPGEITEGEQLTVKIVMSSVLLVQVAKQVF